MKIIVGGLVKHWTGKDGQQINILYDFQIAMGKMFKLRFYKVLTLHEKYRNRKRLEANDSQNSTPILTAYKPIGEPVSTPKYLLAKR